MKQLGLDFPCPTPAECEYIHMFIGVHIYVHVSGGAKTSQGVAPQELLTSFESSLSSWGLKLDIVRPAVESPSSRVLCSWHLDHTPTHLPGFSM